MVFALYLLKVVVCSGILFLYYLLALRNRLFHHWNRFYLLASVALSLSIPLVHIDLDAPVQTSTSKGFHMLQVVRSANDYLDEVASAQPSHWSAHEWMVLAYALVSLVLAAGMITAVVRIIKLARAHAVTRLQRIRFVHTRIPGTPFTFFHFIFWNDDIDLHSEAGQQIFQHELVHVREKHTADKLFLSLILSLFWCNPFFWLVRRELVQLHEFIADRRSVGGKGAAGLAALILQTAYPTQYNQLINPFFYTSIKRRIAMLTKTRNPRLSYTARIAALPLIMLTAAAFTLRTKPIMPPQTPLDKVFTVMIDAGHGAKDGAHSGDVYEADVVLALSREIRSLNNDRMVNIVLTRNDENIVSLKDRVEAARQAHADLFISLHLNAAAPNENPRDRSPLSKGSGFEVYVSGKTEAPYRQQSQAFGSVLAQELQSVYPVNGQLLTRQTGIYVIDKNVCPSVILECGYITDEADRAFITDAGHQKEVAEHILTAIHRYTALGQN